MCYRIQIWFFLISTLIDVEKNFIYSLSFLQFLERIKSWPEWRRYSDLTFNLLPTIISRNLPHGPFWVHWGVTAPQLLSPAASPKFCLDLDLYAHLHICQIGCPPDTCEVLTGTCLGTSSCDHDLLSLPNMSFRSFLKANEPLHQSLLWPEPLFLRCCGTLVFVLHHLHARLLIDWLKEEKCSNTWTSRLNGPIKTFKLKVLEDMGHVL